MSFASEQDGTPPNAPSASVPPRDVVVVAPSQPPRAPVPFWKRALPFAIALILLGYVASQIDYGAFATALAKLNYVPFLAYNASWCVALLAADALGNTAVYRLTMPGVKWRDFFLYRGASYVPTLANYHLGQGYLTYLMSKLAGVPLARMAGATLLMYATWMGCLLGTIAIALPFSTLPMGYVPLILGAGVFYLIVIALRPKALARFSLLTPLFEAGVRGHAIALVARIPHLAVLVLGTWGSFFFFDVKIPGGPALVYLPIVLVATTLPIAPQGFGTREALSALFFSSYAAGATEAERIGQIAACTTSWGVSTTLFGVVIGLVCGRIVSKRLARVAGVFRR